MRKKLRPRVLHRYNINHRIIAELVHPESRKIIFTIIKKSKTIEEICKETGFPISSIYKKIRDLQKISLIYVETRGFSSKDRIVARYRSRIKEAKIEFTKYEPKVILTENNNKLGNKK